MTDPHNPRPPDPPPAPLRQWRCPTCGQIVFGDDAPFVCEYCRDAVTWEAWPRDDARPAATGR